MCRPSPNLSSMSTSGVVERGARGMTMPALDKHYARIQYASMVSSPLITDAGASPGFLLWRVTQRWQRVIAAALRPLELTHAQFVLLMSTWHLARTGDDRGPSQREVADHAEA